MEEDEEEEGCIFFDYDKLSISYEYIFLNYIVLTFHMVCLGTAMLKPSDFFEKEAELSESEWGSGDEDEQDLDKLDIEAGDNEKFDEKKMKSDLEKIHMRRMLDDDQREVRNVFDI